MSEYKINGFDEFISIEENSYGGYLDLILENYNLKDFTKVEASGFFTLTDLLLYEFNKFSEELGTIGKYNFTFEEYSNFLRNYIDSIPYRYFGFASLNAMSKYIQRLSSRRRIEIDTFLKRDIISEKIFKNFVLSGLEKDHPIVLQVGTILKEKLPKYSIITGISEDILTLAADGKKVSYSISEVFDYNDIDLALLYINITP